ncbi:ferritin family protein, partial [Chloroflexota bacterium]
RRYRRKANEKHDQVTGEAMEIEGTRTEENLWAAFAAESQVRNRYIYFADAAREVGLHNVADVFYELAANEGEHAKREFELVGGIGNVRANIEKAAEWEYREHAEIYPQFAQVAREEGFSEIANLFERMSEVEASHRQRCLDLLKDIDGVEEFKGRTVLHSATAMAETTLPHQANLAGFVHGGELMKMMDSAAGVAAVRHCQKNVVTARVEEINFYQPVRVGSLVLVNAQLTFVSRSSMEVRVELDAESPLSGKRSRALSAHFIMVGVEKDGNPTEVTPLLISTEEQQRLFNEGKARYLAQKRTRAKN